MEPEVKKEHKYLPILITVLVMIFVTAAVAGGIWYYMDQQARKTAEDNAKQVLALQKQIGELQKKSESASAASSAATTSTTTQSGTAVVISVPELGIKFTADKSIFDLTYHPGASGTVSFSTKRLASYGEFCIASASPLGTVIVSTQAPIPSTSPDYSPARSASAMVKQVGGKYVYFINPQATCSEDKNAQAMQTSQTSALRASLATAVVL